MAAVWKLPLRTSVRRCGKQSFLDEANTGRIQLPLFRSCDPIIDRFGHFGPMQHRIEERLLVRIVLIQLPTEIPARLRGW